MSEAGATMTERARRLLAQVLDRLRPKDVGSVHGLSFDGRRLWFVDGGTGGLMSMNPETGATRNEMPDLGADAGTATDGHHVWQVIEDGIAKIDPDTREIVTRLSVPEARGFSGLAWAAGALWAGHMRKQLVLKLDPETGEVLKTLRSDRFVTGVTWTPEEDELWHGSTDPQEQDYELRQLDPETGEVVTVVSLPAGTRCSGLGADEGSLWCGDPETGTIARVRRPNAS
ncbi:MAG: SMP-30/gluconolactonase/LRE family protein [Acidobacteriota bacterium]